MASTEVDRLVAQLGFVFDDKDLKKFNRGMGSALRTATSIATAFSAATVAMFGFTTIAARGTDKLQKAAEKLNMTTAAIQEMTYAAEINGASSESMIGALEQLTKNASEASRGIGKTVSVFGMLGVSVVDGAGRLKNADTLFMEVANSIGQIADQGRRLEMGRKLGFTDDLILSFHKGANSFAALRKEAQSLNTVFSEEAGPAAAAYIDSMIRIRRITSSLSNIITTRLQKTFNPLMVSFINWTKINHEIITQRIDETFNAISTAMKGVYNVGQRVHSVLEFVMKDFGGIETLGKVLIGVFTAIAARALIVPIAIASIVVALAALVEDIKVFQEGGDSFLGDLTKDAPEAERALRSILSVLDMIDEGWRLIFTTDWVDAFKLAIKELADVFDKTAAWVDNKLAKVEEFVSLLAGFEGIDIAGTGRDLLNKGLATLGTQPERIAIPEQGNPTITTNNSTIDNTIKRDTTNISGDSPLSIIKEAPEVEKAPRDTFKFKGLVNILERAAATTNSRLAKVEQFVSLLAGFEGIDIAGAGRDLLNKGLANLGTQPERYSIPTRDVQSGQVVNNNSSTDNTTKQYTINITGGDSTDIAKKVEMILKDNLGAAVLNLNSEVDY